MKSKISLYTIIGILIFILVATICPDCAESGSREELEWQKSKKVAEGMSEEEATEAAKKVVEKEQADEAYDDTASEYLNGEDEDEETPIPDEPITYSGDALGLAVILIVNFKTTEVTGSINLSGDDWVDATITDGNINIDTFEINTNFSGIMGSAEYGVDYPFNGTITGKVSDDLSTFNGVILDDEGDGGKFTINK